MLPIFPRSSYHQRVTSHTEGVAMPRWNVECADASTGKEQVVQVEADSRENAEAKARRRGLLVSAVMPSTVKGEVSIDEQIAAAIEDHPYLSPVATRKPPIDYGSPSSAPAPPRSRLSDSVMRDIDHRAK